MGKTLANKTGKPPPASPGEKWTGCCAIMATIQQRLRWKFDMDVIQSIDLITKNPDVRGGKPCVAGTGLRVTDLVMAHLFHKRTADEIATDYNLSLAQVYASLAYYYQHKDELDKDIRQQILTARKAKEEFTGGQPSLLS